METNNLKQHFSQWALVELMGHQRIAGLVSEADFPAGFVRIDVYESDPDVDANGTAVAEPVGPVFTRVVSPSALYAINPVEKAIAIELAKQFKVKPVAAYQVSNLLPEASGSASFGRSSYEQDDEWAGDDEWEG